MLYLCESDSRDLFETNSDDLCERDNGELAKPIHECYRFQPRFLCAASLPKLENIQPSPISLFSDLRQTEVTFVGWTAVS